MIHLGFWQEVQGTFRGIRMDSSRQIVTLERIGDVEVNDVAINAKEGDVIAILRTDLPDREYISREVKMEDVKRQRKNREG